LTEGPTALVVRFLLQDEQLFSSARRERHVRASLGVAARARRYVPTRPRLFGSPWVLLAGLFPCLPEELARQPSPARTGTFRFSPPSCDSPSEFLDHSSCVALSRAASTCLDFRPRSDITPLLPYAEPPQLDWRCPRCSQPFDRSSIEACELIASRSQIQDSFSFRGLSSPCSLQPSSDWLRPCR
jgi:hypothetical protein